MLPYHCAPRAAQRRHRLGTSCRWSVASVSARMVHATSVAGCFPTIRLVYVLKRRSPCGVDPRSDACVRYLRTAQVIHQCFTAALDRGPRQRRTPNMPGPLRIQMRPISRRRGPGRRPERILSVRSSGWPIDSVAWLPSLGASQAATAHPFAQRNVAASSCQRHAAPTPRNTRHYGRGGTARACTSSTASAIVRRRHAAAAPHGRAAGWVGHHAGTARGLQGAVAAFRKMKARHRCSALTRCCTAPSCSQWTGQQQCCTAASPAILITVTRPS